MSKFTTQRNFGFGKQMDWAGHQALKDIYGRGHFGTVASHAQRWRQFCHWARSIHGINDAGAIDQSLLESYAADLADRVEDETLAVSYAQNLIVSANITLEAMRQDKTIRIESPASYVGKRQTVRTKIPDGMDWSEIDRLVACLRAKNLHRAAVIVLLCRSFGIRLREAFSPTCRLATSGKGTRADRYSGRYQGRPRQGSRALGARQRTWPACLREAVQVRNQLGGQNLLRPDETFDDLVNDGEVHRARQILHEFGIKGYHELRAAWSCERYEELSGEAAPVLQAGTSSGQENDAPFRLALARELGHDRVDVVAAYIGARP
jgi:hypothetical protein